MSKKKIEINENNLLIECLNEMKSWKGFENLLEWDVLVLYVETENGERMESFKHLDDAIKLIEQNLNEEWCIFLYGGEECLNIYDVITDED